MNKGNPAPRHWLSLIMLAGDSREADNKTSVGASSLEALREGQPRREAGAQSLRASNERRRPGYRIASSRALIERVPWRKGGAEDAS